MTVALGRKPGQHLYLIDKRQDPYIPISRISVVSLQEGSVTLRVNQIIVPVTKKTGEVLLDEHGDVSGDDASPMKVSAMDKPRWYPDNEVSICFDAPKRFRIVRGELLRAEQKNKYAEARGCQ